MTNKFPYQVAILFPIGGCKQDGSQLKTQLREITDWLNNNVGCEDIRWVYEYCPLSVEEQIEHNRISKAIFWFKLEEASVYFKMVWE